MARDTSRHLRDIDCLNSFFTQTAGLDWRRIVDLAMTVPVFVGLVEGSKETGGSVSGCRKSFAELSSSRAKGSERARSLDDLRRDVAQGTIIDLAVVAVRLAD